MLHPSSGSAEVGGDMFPENGLHGVISQKKVIFSEKFLERSIQKADG
jgi:hypothetical protein